MTLFQHASNKISTNGFMNEDKNTCLNDNADTGYDKGENDGYSRIDNYKKKVIVVLFPGHRNMCTHQRNPANYLNSRRNWLTSPRHNKCKCGTIPTRDRRIKYSLEEPQRELLLLITFAKVIWHSGNDTLSWAAAVLQRALWGQPLSVDRSSMSNQRPFP